MRHNKKGTHLGKTTPHKKAMMRNMAAQVFEHKEIRTTETKAKELRRVVERLITYGKRGTLHHRRLAFSFLRDKSAVTRLFDEIAPTFNERNGGYTRIVKLGYRKGDSASLSLFQLVGFDSAGEKRKKKTEKKETLSKKEAKEQKKAEEKVAENEPAETPEETHTDQQEEDRDKKE